MLVRCVARTGLGGLGWIEGSGICIGIYLESGVCGCRNWQTDVVISNDLPVGALRATSGSGGL